jgi:hypothetical protein
MTIDIETPELDKIELPDWITRIEYTPLQQTEVDDLINNHVWVTARREKIRVSKMTNNHIQNTIRCLHGEGKSVIPEGYLGGKEKWLKIFNTELSKRQ